MQQQLRFLLRYCISFEMDDDLRIIGEMIASKKWVYAKLHYTVFVTNSTIKNCNILIQMAKGLENFNAYLDIVKFHMQNIK